MGDSSVLTKQRDVDPLVDPVLGFAQRQVVAKGLEPSCPTSAIAVPERGAAGLFEAASAIGEIVLVDTTTSAPQSAVRVVAHEKPAFGEPLKGVAGDVYGRRLAIEDEFRQASTNGWGGLEPGP